MLRYCPSEKMEVPQCPMLRKPDMRLNHELDRDTTSLFEEIRELAGATFMKDYWKIEILFFSLSFSLLFCLIFSVS